MHSKYQFERLRGLALGAIVSVGVILALPAQAGDGKRSIAPGSSSSLSDIAMREIARRQQMMDDAKLAIAEGDRHVREEDFESAIGEYKAALDLLPPSPRTADIRNMANAKWADATVSYARVRADNGDLEGARILLEEVTGYDGGHAGARRLLERISDPKVYNFAVTEKHVENVQKVESALRLGVGQFDSGQFDAARESFNAALRIDRYNSAAQNMLERVERELINSYYRDARSQTRAQALADVDALWVPQVPPANLDVFIRERNAGAGADKVSTALTLKKMEMNIPNVSFSEVNVQEAIEFLRMKSKELDPELDPVKKGLNIILMDPDNEATLTLDLATTPLSEVLNYIAELAQLKVKVEAHAVLLVPLTSIIETMYTRVFRVPPDFMSDGGGDGAGAPVDDPFAPDAGVGGGSAIKPRATAREKLEKLGVAFPDGATAYFDPGSSRLIVRNTTQGLDLVEAIIDQGGGKTPKQIYITTKFVEITQTNTNEFGYDWTLGAFNIGGDEVFGSGGVIGNSSAGNAGPGESRFPITAPGTTTPIGANPVTRGLRFGSRAISPDTVDGLIRDEVLSSTLSPGIFGLSGVFTDPQFQMLVRGLDQKKGVDLMSAPSVVTRSGQRAKIEVIREFIYPVEFEPPEIPERFLGSNVATQTDGFQVVNQVSNFPVTPTTPTAFETRNVGVTLEVDPVLGEDGYTIDLSLAPEVVEFEGFINYGSPIQSSAIIGGQPTSITLTENRIEQPVFSTRRLTTALTIWDGQTVGIGGLIREDVQSVEDKVPILGDLPLIGRFWQNEAEEHFKRNLMIFVTARIIDPAGVPVHSFEDIQGVGEPIPEGAIGIAPPR